MSDWRLVKSRVIHEFNIRLLTYRDTGLIMAISDELPGFIVHAGSIKEMDDNLDFAFVSFMRAIGRTDVIN